MRHIDSNKEQADKVKGVSEDSALIEKADVMLSDEDLETVAAGMMNVPTQLGNVIPEQTLERICDRIR